MDDDLLHLIALCLSRGDGALWIGSDALKEAAPDELKLIAEWDWRGVWAEPKGEELLQALRNARGAEQNNRISSESQVLPVPDNVEDVLGTGFEWPGILPYFFLNGPTGQDRLSRRKRGDARRDKENLLEQMKRSTLFVTGFSTVDDARMTLDELSQAAPQLRFVVFDVDAQTLVAINTWAAAQPPELELPARIKCVGESLPSVLKRLKTLSDVHEVPTIRLGGSDIPFQHALGTKPPIDQDFLLITSQDLQVTTKEEDEGDLLRALLRGDKSPWRALRRDLAWSRPTEHVAKVFDAVKKWAPTQNVRCIDIPAEPGSGLTTLLKQIAFALADSERLVLFHVGPMTSLNIDRVRTFAERLIREATVVHDPGVVLIFDAPSVLDDATLTLNGIAHRWAERTETRLLLIRGIPILPAEGYSRYKIHRPKPDHVKHDVLNPLRARLTDEERELLKRWAKARAISTGVAELATAIDRLDKYQSSQAEAPLLLCLYYLLYDTSYDVATSLGRHLYELAIRHCERPVQNAGQNKPEPSEESKYTKQQIEDWVEFTKGQLGVLANRDMAGLELKNGMSLLMTLAALGCLNLSIPRSVLEDVVDLPATRRLHDLYALEKLGLTMTVIGSDDLTRHAPAAFYDEREVVRFVHFPLARLLVEWLKSTDGRGALAELGGLDHSLLSELCNELEAGARLEEYPLKFLKPIFVRLGANTEHRQFAADVSVQYLRLQKRGGGGLEKWKWANAALLLESFGWIRGHVLELDDVLLHSRGITKYKSIRPLPGEDNESADPDVWRTAYKAALSDFQAAYDIVESGTGSEDLGNILVSMGTAKMYWSRRERESHLPTATNAPVNWKLLASDAQDDFELALEKRPDNRFALYGAASFRLENAEWVLDSTDDAREGNRETALKDLETVLALLSGEPEEYFRDEWESTRKSAIALLTKAGREGLLDELKAKHDELGYALEALSVLKGDLVDLAADPSGLEAAKRIMESAVADRQVRPSALGDLLRYVLFSYEHRGVEYYAPRIAKLKRLEKTQYMAQPTWLYDLAMLAFQTGDFRLSNDKFRELRKGRRFYEVPRDRICHYRRAGDPREATVLYLRVNSVDRFESWGRLVDLNFPESIRIAAKAFAEEGTDLRAGMTTRCVIRLFSSGPLAEPPPRRR